MISSVYIKKQSSITAVQYTGKNLGEVQALCPDVYHSVNPGMIIVPTGTGGSLSPCPVGWYVIQDAAGNFDVLNADFFESEFDKVA